MSGIMLSVIGRSYIVPPPVIGSAYQGGYMGAKFLTLLRLPLEMV